MAVTWLAAPVSYQALVVSSGTDGSFFDVDVSADVPTGATGVIMRVKCGGISRQTAYRKNGSTDNRTSGDLVGDGQLYFHVGVDANRIFELYLEQGDDPDHVALDLIGYYGSSAEFFTNGIDKTAGANDAYTDIDISGDVSAGTALAAIIDAYCAAIDTEFAVRMNGSTDDPYSTPGPDVEGTMNCVVGVDGSEIFESCRDTQNLDIFLLGAIVNHVTFATNSPSASPGSTSTWTDYNLNASATGGFFAAGSSASASVQYGVRTNGVASAFNAIGNSELWEGAAGADGSGNVETYRSTSLDYFYARGYTVAGETTVTPNDAAFATTFDTPTLPVDAPVTVNDQSMAVRFDTVTVVAAFLLALNDSAFAMLIEGDLNIVAVKEVTADDATLATLFEGTLTLPVATQVTGADASFAVSFDGNLIIPAVFELVAADCTYASAWEGNINLPLVREVLADESAYAATFEGALVLVLDKLLTVDPQDMAVVFDAVTLQVAFVLTVNDSNMASAWENVDLPLARLLVVDGSALPVTFDQVTVPAVLLLTVADSDFATVFEEAYPGIVQIVTGDDSAYALTIDGDLTLPIVATLTVNDQSMASVWEGTLVLPIVATLSVNDATLPVTFDNVDVDTTLFVNAADSAYATAFEQVTLALAAQLSVNDASMASLFDNVDLAASFLLVVDDCSFVTTFEGALNLAVSFTITADDCLYPLQYDGVNLTIAAFVQPSDSAMPATWDTVTLSAELLLAVGDLLSGVSFEEVEVTGGTELTVEDVAMALTMDNVILVKTVIVNPDNSVYSTGFDAVTLSKGVTLIPEDLSFASRIDGNLVLPVQHLLEIGGFNCPVDLEGELLIITGVLRAGNRRIILADTRSRSVGVGKGNRSIGGVRNRSIIH